MKNFILIFTCLTHFILNAQSHWSIEEMAPMPEPVTNHAVCEGFISGVAGQNSYLYSFGGIDSSLAYSGIHNKSWRYSLDTDTWESIADLPGSEKTIASSASYLNGKIYIIGGYTVASNGAEVSSNKVYIYNIQNDVFETDGSPIPTAIDDHVQCVYKDSLIFVVTGWSNSGNVVNVQIYDTYNDVWQTGTSLPNTNDYKVFGANGTIVGDTLYYYGGANTTTNFPATNQVRKGYINPNDPSDINWSLANYSIPTAYRMACTSVNDTIFWIGGSETSYNFDADAYDGSGIVSPSNQIFQYTQNGLTSTENPFELPMDLRGIASFSETEKYLCGGIENNGKVSNMTLKLTWKKDLIESIENASDFQIKFENPILDKTLVFTKRVSSIQIMNINGKLVFKQENKASLSYDLNNLETGYYFLKINDLETVKILIK